jgi:hypothetical protein
LALPGVAERSGLENSREGASCRVCDSRELLNKHWSAELAKHVLPTLLIPTGRLLVGMGADWERRIVMVASNRLSG